MLLLLLHHTWRWGTLSCLKEDVASIPVPKDGLRRLTHLNLYFTKDQLDEYEVDISPDWFSTATNLKSIELYEADLMTLEICWASVERITFTSLDDRLYPETIYQSLDHLSIQGAPLRFIKLDGLGHYGDLAARKTRIMFPVLETLYIAGYFILDWILAPQLKHLDVSRMYKPPSLAQSDIFYISDFLTQSGSALVSITVGSDFFGNPDSECIKVLKSISSLVRIKLKTRYPGTLAHLSRCLRLDSSGNPFSECLPKLSEINVKCYWGIKVAIDENVVSMLESRCSSASPTRLRLFTLSMEKKYRANREATYIHPKFRSRVALLQKGGLSLCLNGC